MRVRPKVARLKRAIHDQNYDFDSRLRVVTDQIIEDVAKVDPREFQARSECDDCCETLIRCRCMPG